MSVDNNVAELDDEVLDNTTEMEEVEEDTSEDEDDPIRDAFDAGIAEDLSEDEIMLNMIQAGASFRNVKTLYNSYMVDSGLANSRTERAEIVEKTLEGMDLTTEEGFNKAATALVEALKGVNEKSAAQSVRQYAKKHEIEYFKKPKGAGGRSGITSMFYEFVEENTPVSAEQVAEWVNKHGTENTKRHLTHYQGVAKLAENIFEKYASPSAKKKAAKTEGEAA